MKNIILENFLLEVDDFNQNKDKHIKDSLQQVVEHYLSGVIDFIKFESEILAILKWDITDSKNSGAIKAIDKYEDLTKNTDTVHDIVDSLFKQLNQHINTADQSEGYSEIKDGYYSLDNKWKKHLSLKINKVFLQNLNIKNSLIIKHFYQELINNEDLTIRLLMFCETQSESNKKYIINNFIMLPYFTFILKNVFNLKSGIGNFIKRTIGKWLFSITGNKEIDRILSVELLKIVGNQNPTILSYFLKSFDYDEKLADVCEKIKNAYDLIPNVNKHKLALNKQAQKSLEPSVRKREDARVAIGDRPTINQYRKESVDQELNELLTEDISNAIQRYKLIYQVIRVFNFKPSLNNLILNKFKNAQKYKISIAQNDVSELTNLIIIAIMDFLNLQFFKFAKTMGDPVLTKLIRRIGVGLIDPNTHKVWNNNLKNSLVNYINKRKQELANPIIKNKK